MNAITYNKKKILLSTNPNLNLQYQTVAATLRRHPHHSFLSHSTKITINRNFVTNIS